jgi:hypothetical protein
MDPIALMPVPDEEHKAEQLRLMKRRATGLLVLATGVYALTLTLQDR